MTNPMLIQRTSESVFLCYSSKLLLAISRNCHFGIKITYQAFSKIYETSYLEKWVCVRIQNCLESQRNNYLRLKKQLFLCNLSRDMCLLLYVEMLWIPNEISNHIHIAKLTSQKLFLTFKYINDVCK